MLKAFVSHAHLQNLYGTRRSKHAGASTSVNGTLHTLHGHAAQCSTLYMCLCVSCLNADRYNDLETSVYVPPLGKTRDDLASSSALLEPVHRAPNSTSRQGEDCGNDLG
jgi:hypothetical protein